MAGTWVHLETTAAAVPTPAAGYAAEFTEGGVRYLKLSSGAVVQVGEPAAAAAVSGHEGEADPHPQYTTPSEAAVAAPVQSVAGKTGVVTLTPADAGADPAGTAATAVSDHEAAPDPHSQYTTVAEASAAAPVQSVAGKGGVVTLVPADAGADPAGSAASALTSAQAYADDYAKRLYLTAALGI